LIEFQVNTNKFYIHLNKKYQVYALITYDNVGCYLYIYLDN
jgi:hypothetical protein